MIRFRPDSSPGPFSETALQDLLDLIRIDIPDFALEPEYIEFIRKQNGGNPLNAEFMAADGSNWSIDVFLHFCDSEGLTTIETHHHILEFLDDVEDHLSSSGIIPFAITGGGNFL